MNLSEFTKRAIQTILLVSFASIGYSQQLAFPTAEGGGKFTVGGRGGKVCEVTNLNDKGPGSFRAAVSGNDKKTVVFRVSGTIPLKSDLSIGSYTTIAGQTAPGDGICIRNYPVHVSGNHIIMRYIRVRLGDEVNKAVDAITGRESPSPNDEHRNIILDHVSASWTLDECVSIYHVVDVTIQWCILSESLNVAGHGFGAIWGGRNNSQHHNLVMHHISRNVRFCGGGENNDYRNNVVYNWTKRPMYGGEGKQNGNDRWKFSAINVVANYYKPGPSTASAVRKEFVQPGSNSPGNESWYIADNYLHGAPEVTADNWKGVKGGHRVDSPADHIPIKQQTAEEAFKSVMEHVGCSFPKRDPVDVRLIKEVQEGTATFGNGIINSQKTVGGYPELKSTTPPADSDHDGMPDSWETAKGLNPQNAEDRNGAGAGGYTNLEIYLNSLVDEVTGRPTPTIQITSQGSHGLHLAQSQNNTINYSFPKKSSVTLELYSITGKKVATLINEVKEAGNYSADYSSSQVSTGSYICKLSAGTATFAKNIFLIQ